MDISENTDIRNTDIRNTDISKLGGISYYYEYSNIERHKYRLWTWSGI